MIEEILRSLDDDVEERAEDRNGTWLRVRSEAWGVAAEVAHASGLTYFSYLSGMDWLPNPALDGEHAFDAERAAPEPQEVIVDPVVRVAGGTSRFQVIARVADVTANTGVTFVCDLDDAEPAVPTWSHVYGGALWHERETWEMFGFTFVGHPGLRHIYLPEEFSGFPLRKDYLLLARQVRPWPGLVDMEEMPPVESPEQTEEDTQ